MQAIQQGSGSGAAGGPDLPLPPPHVAAAIPSHDDILRHPTEQEFFSGIIAPVSVAHAPLPSFDPGVFDNELLKLGLCPVVDPNDPTNVDEPEGDIKEGTYTGTQLALTEAYSRVEKT